MKVYKIKLGIPSISYTEMTVQAPDELEAVQAAIVAYKEADDLKFDTIIIDKAGMDFEVLEEKIN